MDTFLNNKCHFLLFIAGNQKLEDCSLCEPGRYCQHPGKTEPTGDCEQGFYCPAGQSQKDPPTHICQPGYKCPTGSPAQQLCESGTWTDLPKQFECKECVEGFYCDRKDGPITDYNSYPCPNGYYCPNGTMFSTQYGCLNGTYGNGTRLTGPEQCLQCPAGKYCLGEFIYFLLFEIFSSFKILDLIICNSKFFLLSFYLFL